MNTPLSLLLVLALSACSSARHFHPYAADQVTKAANTTPAASTRTGR
jgi:hypothetical protein